MLANVTEEDGRPMKACPDCAELVLEAARRCRYCGYQFAPAPTPAPAAPTHGVFGFLLRQPARQLTMTETVSQLGVDLAPGEQPTGLWLARVDGTDGYVVLTTTRLFFVAGLRRPANARPPAPHQHRLDKLTGAEIANHHFKSALVLHWHDSPDLSIDGLTTKDLRQLHAALVGLASG